MQPYINPSYFQQAAPIAPYNYRVPAPEQVTGINGKYVMSADQVTPNDVPMDGRFAFFPKQDMSEIYGKCWQSDGTIKTLVFRPFIDDMTNCMPKEDKSGIWADNEVTEGILSKLDELFGKMEQIEKSLGSQRKTTRTQSKESE